MSKYFVFRCGYESGNKSIGIDILKDGSLGFRLEDDQNSSRAALRIVHVCIRSVIMIDVIHNVFVEKITTCWLILAYFVFITLTFGGEHFVGRPYRG